MDVDRDPLHEKLWLARGHAAVADGVEGVAFRVVEGEGGAVGHAVLPLDLVLGSVVAGPSTEGEAGSSIGRLTRSTATLMEVASLGMSISWISSSSMSA
jgi:hypothetical protein